MTCSKVNDLVAGEVQLMFDKAQEPILDRIHGHVVALERQGIKSPRIDGLPSRSRRASDIGGATADVVWGAREGKSTGNKTKKVSLTVDKE